MAVAFFHQCGYSTTEFWVSVATGGSGAIAALRHEKSDGAAWLGYRVLAQVEYLPVVGGVLAIFEAACTFLSSSAPATLLPDRVTLDGFTKSFCDAMEKIVVRVGIVGIACIAVKAISATAAIPFAIQLIFAGTVFAGGCALLAGVTRLIIRHEEDSTIALELVGLGLLALRGGFIFTRVLKIDCYCQKIFPILIGWTR